MDPDGLCREDSIQQFVQCGGSAGLLADGSQQLCDGSIGQRAENCQLIVEMPIERALADIGVLSDVLDGAGVDTTMGEDVQGRLKKTLARLLCAASDVS